MNLSKFRGEFDLDDWFGENYFLFGFDWVMHFHPGDYLGWVDDKPVIIELEFYSSGIWLHDWHIRKYFNYLICYHMNEVDKLRFDGAAIKWIALDEMFEEEIQKERTQDLAKCLGISNPF